MRLEYEPASVPQHISVKYLPEGVLGGSCVAEGEPQDAGQPLRGQVLLLFFFITLEPSVE